jgi:serine/threonine-protein phosphatase 5
VVKEQRFAAAISSDEDDQNVSESICLDDYDVPADYTGARFGEEGVTHDFVQRMMADFKAGALLHRRYAFALLLRVKQLLQALPPVVDIPVPEGGFVTVCGDVHGQFYDLLNIFKLNGVFTQRPPGILTAAN